MSAILAIGQFLTLFLCVFLLKRAWLYNKAMKVKYKDFAEQRKKDSKVTSYLFFAVLCNLVSIILFIVLNCRLNGNDLLSFVAFNFLIIPVALFAVKQEVKP